MSCACKESTLAVAKALPPSNSSTRSPTEGNAPEEGRFTRMFNPALASVVLRYPSSTKPAKLLSSGALVATVSST